MPSPKSAKDTEPTPQPQEAAAPAADSTASAYEYSYFADAVYPHVPLTARAATAETAATVFDWPFGPPTDGRWTPTTKKPNQAADNAGPLTSEE
jgi:hypothetical protein